MLEVSEVINFEFIVPLSEYLQVNVFEFQQEEELKSAILVVLANKQDIEGAMSVTEVGIDLV